MLNYERELMSEQDDNVQGIFTRPSKQTESMSSGDDGMSVS